MQYANDVNLPIFWGTSILWDILTNCITILIIIFMLAIGLQDQWKSADELFSVFVILVFYNFAILPIICILSLFFTKPIFGLIVISAFNLLIGRLGVSFFFPYQFSLIASFFLSSINFSALHCFDIQFNSGYNSVHA